MLSCAFPAKNHLRRSCTENKKFPQSSITTPDPFDVGAILTAIMSAACPTGHAAYIAIPTLSPDGIQPIQLIGGTQHYQDRLCGNDFGIEGGVAGALVCKFNTRLGRVKFKPKEWIKVLLTPNRL